ncbi:Type I Iterative PKS [Arachnomyces sp. PD_36]|nr:Type I Iterative PKS [Arachnomyces sp. PD_36]
MAPEPLVIIGTGCRFPGGASTPSKLWELISNPRDIASKVPADRFNVDAFYQPGATNPGTTNVKESYFLEENIRSFDSPFFNIAASEASHIDPQQRLLLETVYESLEAAGLPLHSVQGSQTGVFCGVMNDDWSQVLVIDMETSPQYSATGTARTNLANRVSYFFDWHGPSFTVDTACSSSMVALHQAAQTLHSGECKMAVVTGANLILSPNMYISATNMHMLSPTGRSRMWDDKADGYARGEGIASIVVKRLSDAIADNDPIECVIRATGVNQDGRSMGLTMPSADAQLQLIKSTYARAGLDPLNRSEDRCQYFEAHGTGTQAGDPQEASAIHRAFFSESSSTNADEILHVGSIKTIIGHTEGTAGLAGIIKGSLSLRNGFITPNLLFNRLNPKLESYAFNLKVPTELTPWPELSDGVPRRVSVNSFGFGGTNSHAILELYDPNIHSPGATGPTRSVLPFVFSATSERVVGAVLKSYEDYLGENPRIDPTDLAWTLLQRRSAFTYRVTFWAPTVDDLRSKIQQELKHRKDNNPSTIVSRPSPGQKQIIGVFTGQGAQWPQMGLDLIMASPKARSWFEELQESLDTLPEAYRAKFSLIDELSALKEESKLQEAAISQPLCTAVQIVLVNLLASLGISFSAVVGHSSGEISAAYAAGLLNASDAIRIAYLRGWVAHSAGSPNGQPGAMIATGLSMDEATALCAEEQYLGRVSVAASNSPASITLSGDADAIQGIEKHLKNEEKFARLLRVDTAYHSHHMQVCSDAYVRAMEACDIKPQPLTSTRWYSSVYSGQCMNDLHGSGGSPLAINYWKDNMVNPVLFSHALTSAATAYGEGMPDLFVEVGPHPALQGPALQTLSSLDAAPSDIRYVGLCKRGTSGIEAFASAIGSFWTHLGPAAIDSAQYASAFSEQPRRPKFVKELPTYPFDHSQDYWYETRMIKSHLHRYNPPHPLLGVQSSQATDGEWRWRNYLRREDLEWIDGHQVQSQTVFPATGYIAMVLEAVNLISASRGHQLRLVQIQHLDIAHAISFTGDPKGTETLFRLAETRLDGEVLLGNFSICASSGDTLRTCASGQITISWGEPDEEILPSKQERAAGLKEIDVDEFYSTLAELGYGYCGLFRGIVSMARKHEFSEGIIEVADSSLLLHPAVMDTGLQSLFAAAGEPGDGELSTLQIPTHIEMTTINPALCGSASVPNKADSTVAFNATITKLGRAGLQGDIGLFSSSGGGIIQFEGVEVSPLMGPAAADYKYPYSNVIWGPLIPSATWNFGMPSREWYENLAVSDHIAFLYLKEVSEQLTDEDRQNLDWTGSKAVAWMDQVLTQARLGQQRICRGEWLQETLADIPPLLEQLPDTDSGILRQVGNNLLAVLRKEVTFLEILRDGDFLGKFYKTATEHLMVNACVGNLVGQVAFRYPRMKILEIGAGTGSATLEVLKNIGHSYHSYTFTDISAGFFEEAQATFADHSDRFIYQVLNIDEDPTTQGFEEHQYDIIVAANVLHATRSLEQTMHRVRRLLKPGGRLVALEGTNLDILRLTFVICGFEGWWLGEQDGRPMGAVISESRWEQLLRKTGFGGFEAITPADEARLGAYSAFVAQANYETAVKPEEQPEPEQQESCYGDLIIVGGTTERTSHLVEALKKSLAPEFSKILHAQDLESLNLEDSALSTASVLNLGDMDHSCFRDITGDRLSGLKALVNRAERLLWVSSGDEADNPYNSMSRGFLLSLSYEYPHCNFQHLNIVDQGTDETSIITSTLKRLADASWANDFTLTDRVDTIEPELRLENGILKIPRLRESTEVNRRYNSARRVIEDRVDLSNSIVRVVQTADGGDQRELVDGGRMTANQDPEKRTIRVLYSTLSAIRVDGAEFLYLVIGRDIHTDTTLLALADQHASVIMTPTSWCWKFPESKKGQEAAFLHTTTWTLLALYLVQRTHPGAAVLVHEANETLRHALYATTAVRNVRPIFSTSNPGVARRYGDTIFFHERSSTHALRRLLPDNVSTAARFDSNQNGVFARVNSLLSEDVVRVDICNLHRPSSHISKHHQPHQVASALNASRFLAAELTDSSHSVNPICIRQVPDLSTKRSQGVEIADWTGTDSLLAQVQPASSYVTLSAHKTYLLVGMSGDLGQSVCDWMISRGARSIVLTSRNPKVEKQWIDKMAARGARVVPMVMDVTDVKSVLHVDRQIHQQLPPVGGVVNGAMVLTDSLFADMSVETMHNQFNPKVRGSLILDELYSGRGLDFFILFGSLVGVSGNWRQSAYSAATGFLSGLVRNRHNRGEVGSIICPGVVRGVGYVSKAGAGVIQYLNKTLSSHAVSERDLHELFAEAILSGSPHDGYRSEICAGMSFVDPIKQPDVIWYKNPKTWDFINYQAQSTSNQTTSGNDLSLKALLATAGSITEALEIINTGFVSILTSKLQLPKDGSVTPDTKLAELGVDSLVAVDIRMWFAKELAVDMSVLQIMGGSSIGQIANSAADKLPEGFLPCVAQASDTNAPEKSSQDKIAVETNEGVRDGDSSGHTSSSYEIVPSGATSDTDLEIDAATAK